MKRFESRRAQGMVEFALIAPLFFMLLLGVIDLGRAGFFFVVGSNLARDGARFGAVYNNGSGYSSAAVASFISVEAHADAIKDFSIPATCGTTTTPAQPPAALTACQTPPVGAMYFFVQDMGGSPHYKKVSTVYAFRPVTPMLSAITGTIYIVATSAMTVEY
ncbi:MAG TPA: TadE/TadG family type IV pilus assembly protein [Candidatus Dormibacteraeota bacterium]|nr:TadE/TadG family type IV pilus assembly protein [Candidatus Dormibacteraeota bacterium]